MTGLEAGAFERLLVLECPDCGRQAAISRDATDPPAAARAKLQCDRCDDGDRHTPEYFDGAGDWVHPTEWMASPAHNNRGSAS